MTYKEIKERAEKFCEINSIEEYPVEIVKVCNNLGIKVFEEYLGPDVSGLIVVDDKKWDKYGTDQFIIVNLTELAVRRRFTIAHELAHYELHRNGNKLYAHRDMANGIGAEERIEREANYFAANILLPEKLVRGKVEDLKEDTWGGIPDFLLVREIADNFVVSHAAAEVRLKQLGII